MTWHFLIKVPEVGPYVLYPCRFDISSPDYWVGLGGEQRPHDGRLERERDDGFSWGREDDKEDGREKRDVGFVWKRGDDKEDGQEKSDGGFSWKREDEDGGEENGEDYDDCYCEDCVVGDSIIISCIWCDV